MNHEESTSAAPEGPTPVDYYWRPGCPFCSMLERKLTKANVPLNKLNIWDDPANADFVRSIANGNETVPTVVVNGKTMINPRAREVIDLVFPDGTSSEPSEPRGLLRRLVGD